MVRRGRSKARGRQSSVSVAANYHTKDTAEAATGASMRAMNYMQGWTNINRAKSARYDSAPRVSALVTKGDRAGGHHLETIDDPWLREWHMRKAKRRQHLKEMGLVQLSSGWEPSTPAGLRDQKRYARSQSKLPAIEQPEKYNRFKMSADGWAKQQARTKKEKAREAQKAKDEAPEATEAAKGGEAAVVETTYERTVEALPALRSPPPSNLVRTRSERSLVPADYDMAAQYETSLEGAKAAE